MFLKLIVLSIIGVCSIFIHVYYILMIAHATVIQKRLSAESSDGREDRADQYPILSLKAINRLIENHSLNTQGNPILHFNILLAIIIDRMGLALISISFFRLSFYLLLSSLSIQ